MYTVDDLTELIRHHVVFATDDSAKADADLVRLVRNIEAMVTAPGYDEPVYWTACEDCGAWVSSELISDDGAGLCEDGGFRCTECRYVST